MIARKANISITYQGVDATIPIREDLLGFSYSDVASGESDSVSLTLKDSDQKWSRGWFPEKGDKIRAAIDLSDWRRQGATDTLKCGTFYVDNPQLSGRPRTLTLDAVSAPLNSNFTDSPRSRTWKGVRLKNVASEIAKRHGLSLSYYGDNNPRYGEIEQSDSPDSAFLLETCEDEGLAVKITDSKIIIFDEKEFEARRHVATIRESEGYLLSYSFESSLARTAYDGVRLKYYDSNLKKNMNFTFAPEELTDNSKIYPINEKVGSGAEARRRAQKKLRALNKKEFTGSMTVEGDIRLVGAACINCYGFGTFDGKYYIERATHDIGGSGYTTQIDIRKVLRGY